MASKSIEMAKDKVENETQEETKQIPDEKTPTPEVKSEEKEAVAEVEEKATVESEDAPPTESPAIEQEKPDYMSVTVADVMQILADKAEAAKGENRAEYVKHKTAYATLRNIVAEL